MKNVILSENPASRVSARKLNTLVFFLAIPIIGFPGIFDFLLEEQIRLNLTYLLLSIVLLLAVLTRYAVLIFLLLLYLSLSFIAIQSYYEYPVFILVPWLGFFAGLAFRNQVKNLRLLALLFFIANFIVLIVESFTKVNPIFGTVNMGPYQTGLTQYTKSAAEYLLIIMLLFRKNIISFSIIFLSAVMVGVRTAWLGIALIYIIDFLSEKARTVHIISKRSFIISASAISLTASFFSFFNLEFSRYRSLIDPNSSAYKSRADFIMNHLDCLDQLPIKNLFLGSGNYCADIIGNGAENFLVAALGYYGIFGVLIISVLILAYIFKQATCKAFRYYCGPFYVVILVGLFSRFPMSFFSWLVIGVFFALYIERRFDLLATLTGVKRLN